MLERGNVKAHFDIKYNFITKISNTMLSPYQLSEASLYKVLPLEHGLLIFLFLSTDMMVHPWLIVKLDEGDYI